MRAFILGNSGELLDHDLSRLKGEAVFGVNALPLFRPDIITHYVCLDIGMAFVPEVRMMVPKTAKKYYSRLMWNTIDHEDDVNVYDTYPDSMLGFAISDKKVYGGLTVTYVAMQIACALGYDELYLLGVDLGLPANGIQHIPQQEMLYEMMRIKNLRTPSDDKQSSFCNKDGIVDHVAFNKPTQARFIFARSECDKHGIKVYNLSKGGNLKAFPRANFEDVLDTSSQTFATATTTPALQDVELNKGE